MVSAVSAQKQTGTDTPKETIHIVKMDKRVSELMAVRGVSCVDNTNHSFFTSWRTWAMVSFSRSLNNVPGVKHISKSASGGEERMIGVIYARYSSDSQREESIEGQLRECYAFAEKQGISIFDTYIDRALSAKTDNRPAFQQMIKDSEKQKFNVVIVWKLDRFARNRYDSATYKSYWLLIKRFNYPIPTSNGYGQIGQASKRSPH